MEPDTYTPIDTDKLTLILDNDNVPELPEVKPKRGFGGEDLAFMVNKCYLHSVLQMLLDNKRFCYEILKQNILQVNPQNERLVGFKTLITSYCSNGDNIIDGTIIDGTIYEFLFNPSQPDVITGLKTAELDTILDSSDQQDARELINLFDTPEFFRDSLQKIYGFENKYQLCKIAGSSPHCNELTEPKSCYLSLKLPPPNKDINEYQFEELLDLYFEPELLEIDHTNMNSMKYNKVDVLYGGLNKSLLIQLNRSYVAVDSYNIFTKNKTQVLFPDIFLDYKLKGFIAHFGDSYNSGGHYVYVSVSNNGWTVYSDSTVTVLTNDGKLDYKTAAYILYYEKFNLFDPDNPGVTLYELDQSGYDNKIFEYEGSIGCLSDGKQIIVQVKQPNGGPVQVEYLGENEVAITPQPDIKTIKFCDNLDLNSVFSTFQTRLLQLMVNQGEVTYGIRDRAAQIYTNSNTQVLSSNIFDIQDISSSDIAFNILMITPNETFENINTQLNDKKKGSISQTNFDNIIQIVNASIAKKEATKKTVDDQIKKIQSIIDNKSVKTNKTDLTKLYELLQYENIMSKPEIFDLLKIDEAKYKELMDLNNKIQTKKGGNFKKSSEYKTIKHRRHKTNKRKTIRNKTIRNKHIKKQV